MPSPQPTQPRIGAFYTEVVLPALAARLDRGFPEFGWKQDARGWVATNKEMTHRVLGARAERVVAHGPAPRGFLVHGGDATLWTADLNGGVVPRGDAFTSVVRDIATRAGVDTAPIDRAQRRDPASELLDDFFEFCRSELRGNAGGGARAYLERRGFTSGAIDHAGLGVVPNEIFTKSAREAVGYSELELARSGVLADGRWRGRICRAWRARSSDAPDLRVFEPERLGDAKDPDAFVREHGIARFGGLVDEAECAVSWRARELIRGITPASGPLRAPGSGSERCPPDTRLSRRTPFESWRTGVVTALGRWSVPSRRGSFPSEKPTGTRQCPHAKRDERPGSLSADGSPQLLSPAQLAPALRLV
jgi:hypothetical protein